MEIKGLKRIAGDSKNLHGYYGGEYIQVNYDLSTGEAWGDYHYSLGQNSWTEYHNPNIICIGNISSPITMSELRERIVETVGQREAFESKAAPEPEEYWCR